jgi:CHAD domain-containing protein
MITAFHQSFGELTAKINNHSENLLEAYQPYDLHQFRVNIRRTRSLLRQLKSRRARYFQRSWGISFKPTTDARDLDVFLETGRSILLPGEFSGFESLLRPRLEASHDTVIAHLESGQWKRHMGGWRGYLHTLDYNPDEVRPGMFKKVRKRTRKACRKALAVDDEYAWHRCRIAVKNLRYVADSQKLDPARDQEKLDSLIEECKILQTLLGDWHDTIVQLQLINGSEFSVLPEAGPEFTEIRNRLTSEIGRRKTDLLVQVKYHFAENGMFEGRSEQAPT